MAESVYLMTACAAFYISRAWLVGVPLWKWSVVFHVFLLLFTLVHEMTCHAWSEMLNAVHFLPCDYSILAHILSMNLVSVWFLLHAPLLFERSDDPRFVSRSHPVIQKGKLNW